MIGDSCSLHIALGSLLFMRVRCTAKFSQPYSLQLQRSPMSQDLSAKSVRKGTKSCLECKMAPRLLLYSSPVFLTCCTGRHRKVRCVWPSDGPETCESCLARGRTCELQVHMIPTSEAIEGTSRARLGHLESDVAGLWAAVRNLEAKLGCVSTEAAPPLQSPSQTENAGGPDNKSNDDDSDSTASGSSLTNPPTHLLQLFDNGLLGSDGDGSAFPLRHAPSMHKAHRSSALRALLPSREDMLTITASASSWLSLYNALFPTINMIKTSDEMLSQYDKLQAPNADPVAIAALLLSIALTVQQAPEETAGRAAGSIRDASSFVKDVSDRIECIVISDDTLAGTLEGMETTLLFIRL